MSEPTIFLPKITPEIYEDHKCFIDGDMDWTQECVDFACLIAGHVFDRLETAEATITALEAEIRQHRDIFAETDHLCQLITGSPPETQIKGTIESLALSLGHWPQVLNNKLEQE